MPNKCFLKNTEGGGLKNFTSEKKKVFLSLEGEALQMKLL